MNALTWNDPLAKFIVFRLCVEQPPASAVYFLAVVLEVHVIVEADVPQTDVPKLVSRFGPCLKPVRAAERHRQRGQCEHAPPETYPSEFACRSRLFFRYWVVRHSSAVVVAKLSLIHLLYQLTKHSQTVSPNPPVYL